MRADERAISSCGPMLGSAHSLGVNFGQPLCLFTIFPSIGESGDVQTPYSQQPCMTIETHVGRTVETRATSGRDHWRSPSLDGLRFALKRLEFLLHWLLPGLRPYEAYR